MNDIDNDHLSLVELRGFVSDSLHGALNEAHGISKATQCSQFMFSLSLNPPQDHIANEEDFIEAADRAEKTLGLSDQPRAIVIHEKEGHPRERVQPRPPAVTQPTIPPASQRRYRYGLEGDSPPWRPQTVFDDGRRVYVVFPRGIVQGEMPPLFVIGSDGQTQLVNTRVHRNILIIDRLFAAAELRLGGENQQMVRIVRTDGVRRTPSRQGTEERRHDR
jgi:hypothetical protein